MVKRIFNIVGWLGMAIIAGAVAIRFGLPSKMDYAYYMALAGLACMLLYVLSQWREIASAFSTRQAQQGTLLGVSVVVVLGILVGINYVGKKQNKRWDLTANQQFSLSDQTKNLLTKLDSPLQMLVFTQEPGFPAFRDRLKEYEYASKQISTQYIDPDKQREVAQQNGVTQYDTIVLKYKDHVERVTGSGGQPPPEQDLTNGIIKVVSGKQKKVYFTSGHGEKDTTASDRLGYSGIDSALTHENYVVDKVVIAQTGSVPDDCNVLVIAGPKNDFLPGEIDAIKKYLDKAGKLLMLIDPPEKFDSPPLTNLIALAHDWGMDVGNNVVVDVSGMGQLIGASEIIPIAASYPQHPITDRFQVITAYPLVRTVTPVPGGVNNHNAQSIVETSPQSWAETDLKDLYASKPIRPGDKKAQSIAAAVSAPANVAADAKAEPDAPKPETRVVVFGDSDFASNSTGGIAGNKDLFMNTIGWLSQQENLISIRPKDASDRRLTLTSAQQTNIIIMAMFIIPGLVFLAGGLTWWRRR